MGTTFLQSRFLLLLGLTVFRSTSGQAQQDTVVKELSVVVVSTQRTQQQLQQVPFSMEVLQQSSMQATGARTTPEALSQAAGVFVQKTNHGGGSPFVRGLTGNQTLILVDGIRLNNSIFRYGPNQYLNTIDPFTIRQIEVAKGTGSVQYGSDAIGGTILLETTAPQFSNGGSTLQGKALGKVVSQGMEQTGRGSVQYANEQVAFEGGLSWRNFGDLVGGDTTGRQRPSGYRELAYDAKLKMRLGGQKVLTVAHQSVWQHDVPVYHKVKLENFAFNNTALQQRSLSYARLQMPTVVPWAKEWVVTASLQNGAEDRESQKDGSTVLLHEKDRVATAGLTLDVKSLFANWWTANSGLELYHDWVGSSRTDVSTTSGSRNRKRGLYPDGARYGNYSLFSLHHFSWKALVAEAGMRYNFFDIRLSDTTLGKVQLTPASFVYNAALLYQLNHQHGVFANYSTGYRAPNIDDMGTLGIVDFRYELPSSSLQPERSKHTEVGYRFRSRKLSLSASVYYLHLNNLITRVQVEGKEINGYKVYQKENVEAAYVKGAEASMDLLLLNNLRLYTGVAYAYGQNITRNEPLRRTPPLNGRMLLQYKRKSWHAAFELAAAAKQDRLAKGDKEDNRIPAGGTPGWQVLNLYGSYRWKAFSINAGLNNLTNADYRTHGSGINGMGRSVWCAVAVNM